MNRVVADSCMDTFKDSHLDSYMDSLIVSQWLHTQIPRDSQGFVNGLIVNSCRESGVVNAFVLDSCMDS